MKNNYGGSSNGEFNFFSYPKPFLKKQEEFIERVTQYLQVRETGVIAEGILRKVLQANTLGNT